jgi:hypothetical protein
MALLRAGSLAVVLLSLVVAVWQITPEPVFADVDAAQEVTPDATATRAVEEAELAALRTQVAELATACAQAACVMPGSPTPTPVPALPMGRAVTYPGDWSVMVTGATLRPTVDDLPGQGPFVQVEVEVINQGSEPRQFPFRDWVLIDAAGRTYRLTADTGASFETGWFRPLTPSLPEQLNVLFAVAADAGDRFILESVADPTFRIQLELAARG